jgi:hypothetical protein
VVATALFRVSSSPPTLLGDDTIRQGDEYEFKVIQKTQLALLKSYFVLNSAARKPGIASLRIFAGQKDTPEDWMLEHLEVEFPNDAEVLQIRLRGTEGQANDLIQIVDAVAMAYSDEVIFKERARQMGTRDLLARSLADLKGKISDKSETMLAIVKDSGRYDEATAAALRQLNLDRLERVELELMRLEGEQLELQGGDEDGNSKFYETRISQLRERQAELETQLAQLNEPSVELNALKSEIELLQQMTNELEIKLQMSAIDRNAPSRIEQIQPAVVTPAE